MANSLEKTSKKSHGCPRCHANFSGGFCLECGYGLSQQQIERMKQQEEGPKFRSATLNRRNAYEQMYPVGSLVFTIGTITALISEELTDSDKDLRIIPKGTILQVQEITGNNVIHLICVEYNGENNKPISVPPSSIVKYEPGDTPPIGGRYRILRAKESIK